MKSVKNPYLPAAMSVRDAVTSVNEEVSKASGKAKARYPSKVQSNCPSEGGPKAKMTRAYDPTGGLPSGA